ncbi:MAG: aminopeptidase [Firmicutes bacterium]|nr:aminopeptidase [Bacillota bacterium]
MAREKSLWEIYTEQQLQEMEAVNARYRELLDRGKTERECAKVSIEMAQAAGYRPLDELVKAGSSLCPGDKVYAQYNGKTLVLYHIGTEPIENGMNILGAHIDSPRIDVKQNPLYESTGLAYLDTHYYGGIKKYQWVTIPLAIHGVVIKKDGSRVDICLGENEDDPVFAITDLLIHLAQKQMTKDAAKVIEGEGLDVLVGSVPRDFGGSAEEESAGDAADSEKKLRKTPVKANILQLLKERYGIEEEDFLSAELEVVPAGRARELGFDRSMILSYGQDDRICAFTSLMAMLETDTPKRTACCLLVDKEEVGSQGASGMQSRFFENMTAEVLALMGYPSALSLRRTLQNSSMLSSDVSAGFDPLYADVFETKNAAYLGKGVVFNKFTGARGKSGSSDANPEFMAAIRRILDENEVQFQTAELGKVDVGGGGTIAWIMANYGMEVIDCGLAVLCMHAPMEISSKADVYEGFRAYKVFLEHMTNIYGL